MPELSEAARQQGELWGADVGGWLDIQRRFMPPLHNFVLDRLEIRPGERLLDAGCGAGGASHLARSRGAEVTGFDPSEGMLQAAAADFPQIPFQPGELENIPFPDSMFDAAMAINSLQFTPRPERGLLELLRVTRPGGRIAVVVWNQQHSEQRVVFDAIRALFPKPPAGRGAFELAGPGELEALLAGLRFTLAEIDISFAFDNLEAGVRAQMGTGPSQRAAQILGRPAVEDALRRSMSNFAQPDGSLAARNRFRCALVQR
ncbi:MAG: class I SAM-dependent methyltransferase [Bryobacteraceae bacterium]|nr:class I SAM-dependent methyltransferase [Bryobacteraceae bacterium]